MPLSFDEIARTFDDQRGLPAEALQAFIAFVDEIAQGRMLEVIEPGIGTGRIALPLAVAGHHVTGIDISQPMLDACHDRAESSGVADRVTLLAGNATDLPVDSDVYNLGVIASLLYLVPDWESALDELARVVRPGGAVIQVRERTESGAALSRWDAAWRDRVESTGFAHQPVSPTDDEVLDAMRRRWPDLEIRSLASWAFGQTVGEGRRGYGERLQPLYPGIPDPQWASLVRGFLDWSERMFPDPDTLLGGEVVLDVVVSRT